MAKTMAFLVAFVVLLSLDYFVSAEALAKGGMKTSHWTGRQQTSASSPELFPNCRSKVLSLLVLPFCLFYFVLAGRWCGFANLSVVARVLLPMLLMLSSSLSSSSPPPPFLLLLLHLLLLL